MYKFHIIYITKRLSFSATLIVDEKFLHFHECLNFVHPRWETQCTVYFPIENVEGAIGTSQEAHRSASEITDGTSPGFLLRLLFLLSWQRPRESGIIEHVKPLSAWRIECVLAWRKEILGLIGTFLMLAYHRCQQFPSRFHAMSRC